MKTGNVIASSIILLWGLSLIIVRVVHGASASSGSSAYDAGHSVAFLFAIVMVGAGARGLYKEVQRKRATG